MFIYFALAIGLAAGVGLYAVSLIGTFCIGLIIWIVTEFKVASNPSQVFTLQLIHGSNEEEAPALEAILKKFCFKYRLQGSKSGVNNSEIFTRLTYHLIFKNGENSRCLIQELHSLGVKDISVQSAKD